MSDDPKPPASTGPERPTPQRGEDPLAAATGGGYRVQLPTFEGPLDLLLHLIQEHELDILNIPIGFVAEKYVEYITLLNELNIDVASEYLVMAATLAHIKSKMLLPSVPEDQEEAETADEVDPRAELVRRLLEYQKYKQAAEELGGRSMFGRDVFGRGAPAPTAEGTPPLAPISLFKLIDAFQVVLDRAKIKIEHEIDFERFSITDRINQLADVLRNRPRVAFEDLFADQNSRAELIVTFLALLEMTRLRMTRLYQEGPLEPIYIELSVVDEGETSAEPAPAAAETTTADPVPERVEPSDRGGEAPEPSGGETPASTSPGGDVATPSAADDGDNEVAQSSAAAHESRMAERGDEPGAERTLANDSSTEQPQRNEPDGDQETS